MHECDDTNRTELQEIIKIKRLFDVCDRNNNNSNKAQLTIQADFLIVRRCHIGVVIIEFHKGIRLWRVAEDACFLYRVIFQTLAIVKLFCKQQQ